MKEMKRREFLEGAGLLLLAGATGAAVKDCPGLEVGLLEYTGEDLELQHSFESVSIDPLPGRYNLEAFGTQSLPIQQVVVTGRRGFRAHAWIGKRYVNLGNKDGAPVILESDSPEGPWELAEVVDSLDTPD